jgi:hypothetical protein
MMVSFRERDSLTARDRLNLFFDLLLHRCWPTLSQSASTDTVRGAKRGHRRGLVLCGLLSGIRFAKIFLLRNSVVGQFEIG